MGALDVFDSGIATYQRNFGEIPAGNTVRADAGKNNIVDKFQKQTSLKPGDVDVVIGGPPCQGFSNVGRVKIASLVKNGKRNGSRDPRFIDDKRNHLYKSFIRFVDRFKPRAVVMENVVGMVSYRNGRVVLQILDDFKKIGYGNVSYSVLNAADYGVPQSRRRIFFIAVKSGIPVSWPPKTHSPAPEPGTVPLNDCAKYYVTVGDALGDLPALDIPKKGLKVEDMVAGYARPPACDFQKWARTGCAVLHNNVTRWHREKDIEVFGNMKQGQKWSQLSGEDRAKIGYSNNSFNDKWKRLSTARPSWTITAHLARDGYMFIHPEQNRTISVREAARLQSFPDSFVFCGSRTAQFRQVGNAVPPLLAMAVGKHLKQILGR